MARDYDPVIGRYIQSDPVGLVGGINTYGYVAQNPLLLADPSGMVVPDPIGNAWRGFATSGFAAKTDHARHFQQWAQIEPARLSHLQVLTNERLRTRRTRRRKVVRLLHTSSPNSLA
jgi:uncharacterized protein RhaS with RHS repeats